MLYRIQADADMNGLLQPEGVQVFDAPIVTDPVTDQQKRGDVRMVKVPLALRQAFCDWVNQRAGGLQKYQDRLAAERADYAAQQVAP